MLTELPRSYAVGCRRPCKDIPNVGLLCVWMWCMCMCGCWCDCQCRTKPNVLVSSSITLTLFFFLILIFYCFFFLHGSLLLHSEATIFSRACWPPVPGPLPPRLQIEMTVSSLCVGAGGQTQVLTLVQQALPPLSHLWPHVLFRGTASSVIKYPAWGWFPRLRQQAVVSSLRICCALVGRRTCRENDLDIIGAAAAILELVREARQEDYSW